MAYKQFVLVCGGMGCEACQNGPLLENLRKEVEAAGLAKTVQVVRTGCLGFCGKGAVVKILPDEVLYVSVKPEDAKDIVRDHLAKGRPVSRLLYDRRQSRTHVGLDNMDFYQKQFRIVLRNCGIIDPNKIDEYIARDGYVALEKVLFDMTADDVLRELDKSGLRGRGGAGFPTGKKWLFSKNAVADQKYIVCNADEGDPGAYMDRSTLEGDPHSVIEAMIIAGKTIGASKGFFYIRAEYPLAVERVEKAIRQARAAGLVGKNILDSGWAFDFDIRLGAGAFVCGEETALIASVEGKRGTPRPRPPFPAVKGLWDQPSCVNNVETLANVPRILLKGAEWFAAKGTEKSKGTKVFALTGKIKNNGLVEVPMGTTIRQIVETIGGGTGTDRKVKAVQTGGPSGGMIPESQFDTPISYEHLQQMGSMMGSGGLIVIDDHDSVVELVRFYLDFCVDESCGKCAPCRIGGKQMLKLLDRIVAGEGTAEDVKNIRMIAQAMQKASLCALGQTAPNPVLSALKHFEVEFNERLQTAVTA